MGGETGKDEEGMGGWVGGGGREGRRIRNAREFKAERREEKGMAGWVGEGEKVKSGRGRTAGVGEEGGAVVGRGGQVRWSLSFASPHGCHSIQPGCAERV